jgi:hypothetical protein
VVIFKILAKKHMEWLDKQSPMGTWINQGEGLKTIIQFEGGPDEGLYHQVVEKDKTKIREFGHWFAKRTHLRMLIMGTDVNPNPRMGQDTIYIIRYIGPTKISISGPARNLIFEKTNKRIVVDKTHDLIVENEGDNS